MRVAYVMHDGGTLRRAGNRLQLWAKRELVQEVSALDLNQLVVTGNIMLTPGAMQLLLRRGIDTVLLTHHGKFLGRLVGQCSGNITLRIAQHQALADPARQLGLSQALVVAKIESQRALLLRHGRAKKRPALTLAARRMGGTQRRVALCTTLDQVRGCEGSAAALYFGVLAQAINAKGIAFNGRNRRPPLDPVNVLLSLGYTVLSNVVEQAIEVVGLDPYLGALHAPLAGRPSLVCDLVEEHRAPVVDALVIAALNKQALRASDFRDHGPGEPCEIDPQAMRWFLTLFERRLERRALYAPTRTKISYRECIQQQVRRAARFILNDEPYGSALRPRSAADTTSPATAEDSPPAPTTTPSSAPPTMPTPTPPPETTR